MIAEAIEGSPARDRSHEVPVLALIQKRARLLTRPGCGKEFDSVLVHLDLARHIAVQDDGFPCKALLGAKWRVVSGEYSRWLDQRAERLQYLLPEALQSRAHELHDQPLVIPVANQ